MRVQIYSIDLLKLILALLIVSIHITLFKGSPLGEFISKCNSIAVPTFFTISSFLFFHTKYQSVLKYVKRIGLLYLFWFVVLLPFTLHDKAYLYFSDNGVWYFLRDFFLCGTFRVSWFLSATVISIVLVYFVNKLKYGALLALIIGLVMFYLSQGYVQPVSEWWENRGLGYLSVSFFYSTVFIAIGNIIAQLKIVKFTPPNMLISSTIIFAFIIIYGCIYEYNEESPYIRLIGSVLLTIIVLSINIANPTKKMTDIFKFFRTYSIILYLTHFPLGLYIIPHICKTLEIDTPSNEWIYLISVLCIAILTYAIMTIEKRPYMKWLKYSH